jgi:hypothetical protein
MSALRDDDFVQAFLSCTLPAEQFHHADHVRLGWLMLRRAAWPQALVGFCEGLKRYATSLGQAGLYHETITVAYLLLIHERQEREGASTFAEFAARHSDLLSWRPSVLDRYYLKETLASDLARRTFVLPDRLASGLVELQHQAGRAHGEGRGQQEVGEGHEQGQEPQEAEAQ